MLSALSSLMLPSHSTSTSSFVSDWIEPGAVNEQERKVENELNGLDYCLGPGMAKQQNAATDNMPCRAVTI